MSISFNFGLFTAKTPESKPETFENKPKAYNKTVLSKTDYQDREVKYCKKTPSWALSAKIKLPFKSFFSNLFNKTVQYGNSPNESLLKHFETPRTQILKDIQWEMAIEKTYAQVDISDEKIIHAQKTELRLDSNDSITSDDYMDAIIADYYNTDSISSDDYDAGYDADCDTDCDTKSIISDDFDNESISSDGYDADCDTDLDNDFDTKSIMSDDFTPESIGSNGDDAGDVTDSIMYDQFYPYAFSSDDVTADWDTDWEADSGIEDNFDNQSVKSNDSDIDDDYKTEPVIHKSNDELQAEFVKLKDGLISQLGINKQSHSSNENPDTDSGIEDNFDTHSVKSNDSGIDDDDREIFV